MINRGFHMSLECISPPAELAVGLDALLRQVKREPGEDDEHLQHCLEVAIAQFDGADGELGRALVRQTWRETFDAVPGAGGSVELGLSPVTELVQVEIRSAPNVWEPVPLEAVELFEREGRFYVMAARWPGSGRLRIHYVAGYGAPQDVPLPIRHAILLFAAHLSDVRGLEVTDGKPAEVPVAIARLVANYRIWWT